MGGIRALLLEMRKKEGIERYQLKICLIYPVIPIIYPGEDN